MSWETWNQARGTSLPGSVSSSIISSRSFTCMQDQPHFASQHVTKGNDAEHSQLYQLSTSWKSDHSCCAGLFTVWGDRTILCWLCWPDQGDWPLLVMLAYSLSGETDQFDACYFGLFTDQGNINAGYVGLFSEREHLTMWLMQGLLNEQGDWIVLLILAYSLSRDIHQLDYIKSEHTKLEFWMCSASDTFTDFLNFF